VVPREDLEDLVLGVVPEDAVELLLLDLPARDEKLAERAVLLLLLGA
jgi:hypothetical protein